MRESEEDKLWKSLPSFMKAFGRHNATFFGIAKASPDDEQHPGYPAGAAGGVGGQFRPKGGTSGMDIDKAVKHLDDNAEDESQGYCATYVHEAISAGGVRIIPPKPAYAKNYGPTLEAAGFARIPVDNYVPQKGDVILIQNYPGGNIAGHMEMYNGTSWVSDFKQKSIHGIYPGSTYAKLKPAYAIYRP